MSEKIVGEDVKKKETYTLLMATVEINMEVPPEITNKLGMMVV